MTRPDILPPRYASRDDHPIKLVSVSTYNRVVTELGREGNVRLAGEEVFGIKPLYTNFTNEDYVGNGSPSSFRAAREA
ncbi:hypothetical protein [Paenibacillus ginsengarvi]|uniref:Uncharacterized protein n=1 Tax=Paenibacillus ginsengarvi TaxID=400777 RepID=A0A3B0CC79_9BACL|nr:hypothetical protein [Paenibacillus ginsengarvi]RKN80576.1 hypothetical protein D7M11_19000 [Paenibacillus ginsengarvi]